MEARVGVRKLEAIAAHRAMFSFKSQDEEHRCRIHRVSPYGCSHFDAHQTNEEADLGSSAGHYQVDLAWKNDRLYARLWLLLKALGRVAPSPVESRARMRAAIEAQGSSSFPRAKTNDGDDDE
jgi:hypothetical protein